MNAIEHLKNVIDFVSSEFCEVCREDCNTCTHYGNGSCPILTAEDFLTEEGYSDDE